jgi:hypothetical protein
MQNIERPGSQKLGLWCNWIFVALTTVGWLGIAHFHAPARADLGLEATKVWFTETHHWGTIIGCTIFYIAAGILTPGSIAFGIMLARIEGRWPLWSITTAVCGVFISLIVFFNACARIVAAYRPETGADVIQAWSDWAWFAFLLGWIYLAIEMIASGVVELLDDRPETDDPALAHLADVCWSRDFVLRGGPGLFQERTVRLSRVAGFLPAGHHLGRVPGLDHVLHDEGAQARTRPNTESCTRIQCQQELTSRRSAFSIVASRLNVDVSETRCPDAGRRTDDVVTQFELPGCGAARRGGRVVAFVVPHLMDALPHTATGKVQKAVLRQRLREALSHRSSAHHTKSS